MNELKDIWRRFKSLSTPWNARVATEALLCLLAGQMLFRILELTTPAGVIHLTLSLAMIAASCYFVVMRLRGDSLLMDFALFIPVCLLIGPGASTGLCFFLYTRTDRRKSNEKGT